MKDGRRRGPCPGASTPWTQLELYPCAADASASRPPESCDRRAPTLERRAAEAEAAHTPYVVRGQAPARVPYRRGVAHLVRVLTPGGRLAAQMYAPSWARAMALAERYQRQFATVWPQPGTRVELWHGAERLRAWERGPDGWTCVLEELEEGPTP